MRGKVLSDLLLQKSAVASASCWKLLAAVAEILNFAIALFVISHPFS